MRVAVAQIEPKLGEKEQNLAMCFARLEEAAAAGAELLVSPSARSPATCSTAPRRRSRTPRRSPGRRPRRFERECARLGIHAITGLLERDGDTLYNAAILVGPDGLIGSYRKTHLPFLGVDRFVTPGDELQGLRHAARPDRR